MLVGTRTYEHHFCNEEVRSRPPRMISTHIDGLTQPCRLAVEVAMPRWRWLQSLRRWGVPRTRGRALSREEVDAYVLGLTRPARSIANDDLMAVEIREATHEWCPTPPGADAVEVGRNTLGTH